MGIQGRYWSPLGDGKYRPMRDVKKMTILSERLEDGTIIQFFTRRYDHPMVKVYWNGEVYESGVSKKHFEDGCDNLFKNVVSDVKSILYNKMAILHVRNKFQGLGQLASDVIKHNGK